MSDLATTYREKGYWTDRQLTDFFEDAVATSPDKIYVQDDRHGAFTYSEISPLVMKLASALQQRGIVRGDRFVIALPNWYHAPVFALALNYLGAVCVHIPATGGSHEFAGVLKVSGAKGIVTPHTFGSSNYIEMIDGIREDLENLELCICVGGDLDQTNWETFDTIMETATGSPDLSDRADPADMTALLFTSGSSGAPKGVMHSSISLTAFNTTIYPMFELGSDDIIFMGAPLGFSAGLIHGLRLATVLGCTLILQEAWNSEKALATMAREKATFSLTTPTLLHDMFQSPAFAEYGDKINLKLMFCGGMYVPSPLLAEARKRWPNTLTSVIWGMTEGNGASCRYDTPPDRIINTDGQPFPGTELRILREDGTDADPGETGDLIMRGPPLFLGYFNRPELDSIAFLVDETGRWFYTGDVGKLDAGGYLKLTGRKKELIIRGGANLSPSEIEEKLMGDPRIKSMLVVGIPDERLGERVCACIIPSDGCEDFCLDDLTAIAKASGLSKAKWPERLEIIDVIPTTSAGKIQRHVLQEKICKKIEMEQASA